MDNIAPNMSTRRHNIEKSNTDAFAIFNDMLEHKGAGTRAFVGEVLARTRNKWRGKVLSLALTHRDVPDTIVSGCVYTEVTTPKEAIQAAMDIVCASRITGWEIEVFLPKINVIIEDVRYVNFTVKHFFPDDWSPPVSTVSVYKNAIDDKAWRTANLVQPIMKVTASDTNEEAADILKLMQNKWDNLMNPKPYTDAVPKANTFDSGLATVDWIYYNKADDQNQANHQETFKAEPFSKDKADGDNAEAEEVWSRTHRLLAFLGSSLNFNGIFRWLRNSPELIQSVDLPATANEVLEERIRTGGDVAMQAHGELLRRTTHESLPTERRVGEKVATKNAPVGCGGPEYYNLPMGGDVAMQAHGELLRQTTHKSLPTSAPVGFGGPEYYNLPPGCEAVIRFHNYIFSEDGTLLEAN